MDEQMNQPPQPMQPQGGQSDVDKNKAFAIIGYIIPILFFIPLITDGKNSPFAKFHANQQLVLLISWIVLSIVGMIPVIGWILYPIGIIVLLVFAILGLINAAKGETKQLPMIGGFSIIK